MTAEAVPARLSRHLRQWLGKWPAETELDIVGSVQRTRPGWDGAIHPALGIGAPGRGVLSVSPHVVERLRRRYDDLGDIPALGADVPTAVGRPEHGWYRAVFRWTTAPTAMPEAGVWVPAGDVRVPGWLRPFGGEVLVAFDPDAGDYLAGVGIKRHDDVGHEIAVGTEERARGKGLARRLVAQAARRILDEGAVPTYLHDVSNHASATVAAAAGFPDRGWTGFGVTEEPVRRTPARD